MQDSIALRRLGYRLAFRVLALLWTQLGIRPDGVKCLIADGERLLLVRHSYGPRGWDLPGGAHRRREPPADTARREMAEELGLPAGDWRDLGALRSRSGAHRVGLLTTDAPPGFHPTPDPVELLDAAWFPRNALPTWRAPLLEAAIAAGVI